MSQKKRKPFHRGQKVECKLDGLLLKKGQQYRVISCEPDANHSSGFLVTVARLQHGPFPKRKDPPIAGMVDAGWFKSARELRV